MRPSPPTRRAAARRTAAASAAAALLAALAGCAGQPPTGLLEVTHLADTNSAAAVADGDLWPSCWAEDGDLYAAYGDGNGFGTGFSDIGLTRITGTPEDGLDGENLATGDELGQVWSGEGYTRKPTGMLCVDGSLYLAVQDLRHDFNAAPAATIARSDDHGRTWRWDAAAPMFSDGVFTTVMFLDHGQGAEHAPDGHVYAYGLDGNWRDSFDDSVPDPQDLYLARVPRDGVQDRERWEFYAAAPGEGPAWSGDIAERTPVLHDETVRYEGASTGAADLTVLSQGGIVYVEPLETYLYTSWTELTFEFYTSPQPWGPWTHVFTEDFGPYPWPAERHGGYGLTVPSKFISSDGRTAWLQSNVCPCAPAGMSSYYFGLRELGLEVAQPD